MNDQHSEGRGTDEREFREHFEALRAESGAPGRVPDFDAMLTRARDDAARRSTLEVVEGAYGARTRHRVAKIGGWVTLATAAAAAGLLFVGVPSTETDADAEFERLVAAYSNDAASGAWRSPTAPLLEMPGLDLGSVPSIGGSLQEMNPNDSPAPDGPEGRDL